MMLAATAFALMQATAVLTGTVLTDSTERPIANAEISIVSLGLTARSDSVGNFTIGKIPRGAYEVTVRALGFGALSTRFSFADGQRIETDLLMQIAAKPAQRLAAVDVKAKSSSGNNPRIAEFDERRKFGIGKFLPQAVFEKAEGRKMGDVLIGLIPGIRTLTWSANRAIVSTRGAISLRDLPKGDTVDFKSGARPACYAQIVIDGLVRYMTKKDYTLFNIDSIDPSSVAAMEYYTVAETPPQFNFSGNAPCGTLVIWTRY